MHRTRTYSQMHCTDKYSEHSSIIVRLRTKWFWVRVQLQSQVTSSNPGVTSSNPRVTSSNPRVQESLNN